MEGRDGGLYMLVRMQGMLSRHCLHTSEAHTPQFVDTMKGRGLHRLRKTWGVRSHQNMTGAIAGGRTHRRCLLPSA